MSPQNLYRFKRLILVVLYLALIWLGYLTSWHVAATIWVVVTCSSALTFLNSVLPSTTKPDDHSPA